MTFIDASAVAAGMDKNFSIYLVSIINAVTIVSRIGGGLLADYYGVWPRLCLCSLYLNARDTAGDLNVITPFVFASGVLTFVWPFMTSKMGFGVLAGVYGYVIPACVYWLSD